MASGLRRAATASPRCRLGDRGGHGGSARRCRGRYEETIGNSLVIKEPIGVVGCITPWNYPLRQVAAKVAYAMAAGYTRMLVPASRMDKASALAARAAEAFVVGDPFVESTKLGPLASAAHRDRVQSYIRVGIEEGATLIAGGPDAPDDLTTGYYVRPTVFAKVKPSMTIASEEIFGPVLSIIG